MLDALYGTEFEKKANELIDSNNRIWQQLDEHSESLAELKESSKSLQGDQKQVSERIRRLERSPYL